MNKYLYRFIVVLTVFAVVLPVTSALSAEESEWKALKKEEKREKIDMRAAENLELLFTKSPKAKELYDKAHGWAAFHNLKLAIGLTAGGGKGVAIERESDKHTYMEMATVGVGVSLGGQKSDLIFLFEDSHTYQNFVDNGWQADASANAVAGVYGANATTGFVNGLVVFQLSDAGLMASADVAGTKYWKDGNLNNE